MPASGRGALALAAVLVAGCVTRTERLTPRGTAATLGTPALIQDIVRQALVLDSAGDRAADTLSAADAIVVANARVRLAAPRFAGVGYGGRVTVAAAAAALEGRCAWVMADYRWINSQRNQAEAGRGTVVSQEQP